MALGHLARFDPRDILLYRFNHLHGRQQVLNTAIAATLFHRKHGQYPDSVEQLVPDFLTAVPIDMDEGRPIVVHPLAGGLIIAGNFDRESIEYQDPQSFDREFAESLSSAVFLGPAYMHFFKDSPAHDAEDDSSELTETNSQ